MTIMSAAPEREDKPGISPVWTVEEAEASLRDRTGWHEDGDCKIADEVAPNGIG